VAIPLFGIARRRDRCTGDAAPFRFPSQWFVSAGKETGYGNSTRRESGWENTRRFGRRRFRRPCEQQPIRLPSAQNRNPPPSVLSQPSHERQVLVSANTPSPLTCSSFPTPWHVECRVKNAREPSPNRQETHDKQRKVWHTTRGPAAFKIVLTGTHMSLPRRTPLGLVLGAVLFEPPLELELALGFFVPVATSASPTCPAPAMPRTRAPCGRPAPLRCGSQSVRRCVNAHPPNIHPRLAT
jgi:hypothetical protein